MNNFCKVLFRRSGIVAAMLLVLLAVRPAKADPKAFEYLLPDSDTRIYTAAEVGILSLQETSYAKNEIYARHGRKFFSRELTEYFGEQPWYSGTIEPEDFSDSMLNEAEQANILVLHEREFMLSPDGYQLDQPGYSFDEVNEFLYGDRFNILQNLEIYGTEATSIMESDHFYMLLPTDVRWMYRQIDGESFALYYQPETESVYDGWIVTIRAYDWDEDEYVDAPSWTVCGLSETKKYVAFFPTDVRFDPNDPAFEQGYRTMMEWSRALDYEAIDNINPFSTKD